MRSDSFVSEVVENIARTAPPFAGGRLSPAEDHRAPQTQHRSFFSWLRRALAYEPLHDDSPGRDAMRVRIDAEAAQVRRRSAQVPAQHNYEKEADPARPEQHEPQDQQTEELGDQPAQPADPEPHAGLQQHADRRQRERMVEAMHKLADLEAARSMATARADGTTGELVRLVTELLRNVDLDRLDPTDPLNTQYVDELLALRATLNSVLGQYSLLARPSQPRDPRAGRADADPSDDQPEEHLLAQQPLSGGPGRSQRPLHEVQFLTVAETASVMRVSKMTVYKLVHAGLLPAIRVGRSFRVPENAVHAFLRESLGESLTASPEQRDGS